MNTQHGKIPGYRDLSEAEIALIKTIKSEGLVIDQMVRSVHDHLKHQLDSRPAIDNDTQLARIREDDRIRRAEPQRWASIARTHFQEGLMALTRAVAQPDQF